MDSFIVDNIECVDQGVGIDGKWAEFTCSVNGVADKVSLTTRQYQDDPMPPLFQSREVTTYLVLNFHNAENQAAYKELQRFNGDAYLNEKFMAYADCKDEILATGRAESIDELMRPLDAIRDNGMYNVVIEKESEEKIYADVLDDLSDKLEHEKSEELLLKSLSAFEDKVISSAPKLGENNSSVSTEKVFADAIFDASKVLRDSKNAVLNSTFTKFLDSAKEKINDGTFAFIKIPFKSFEKATKIALKESSKYAVVSFLTSSERLDNSFSEIKKLVDKTDFDIDDKDLYEVLTSNLAIDLSDDVTVPEYLKESEKSQSLTQTSVSDKATKKYSLTDETRIAKNTNSITLHRIKAEKDFFLVTGSIVKKGDLGGFVESEENLSQFGKCWIDDNAVAMSKSRVLQNACIRNDAYICGNAKIDGDAVVVGDSLVFDRSHVGDNAVVGGKSFICDKTVIAGNSSAYDSAIVGNSTICDCFIEASRLDKVMLNGVNVKCAKLKGVELLYQNNGEMARNLTINGQMSADKLMEKAQGIKTGSKLAEIKGLGTQSDKNATKDAPKREER